MFGISKNEIDHKAETKGRQVLVLGVYIQNLYVFKFLS